MSVRHGESPLKKNMVKRGRSQTRRNGSSANQSAAREPEKLTKSRLRWEAILQAATELFNRKGFHAASMQDIADLVGIKKGSLYYYVDTKEELLFQILRDLHQGGEALVEAANFRSIDPLGELRSLLLQMGIYAGKHAGRMEIFNRDFDRLTASQQKMILSERRLYWDAVVKLIRVAIRKGQVSDTLDPRVAAQAALRAVSSISHWYRGNGDLKIEQIAAQTAVLMVQGLANYNRR
ncbi:TetR/AcrR family transcriptional regulator [Povalibacter sp.]|uniref:TetR/AcrR family transcriptional regulator n=1 Tax=Povalibacter sp. TaxID=1962978 RepID=UPI002F40B2DA